MLIHAVLFDLFETLVTELNQPVRRASSLASQLTVEESAYKREWKARRPEIILGRCSFHDALAQIAAMLGGVADEALLESIRSERVAQKTTVLKGIDPDILAGLQELRRRGLKLGVVTNAFPEDVAGWDRSPLQPLFEVTVFSHAVRLAKPDPAIYAQACRALGVSPPHTLFVSDSIDEVAGAKAAGLRATRALWFASRWPKSTVTRDEPGLWRMSQVVDAASTPQTAA